MRDLTTLDDHRLDMTDVYGHSGGATEGAFRFPSPVDGQPLQVIASTEDEWDHVSVSRKSRVPNWPEMEFVRKKFFNDEETVMQLHVPVSDHINHHPFCLHLWRPQKETIPRPPGWMVGPKSK